VSYISRAMGRDNGIRGNHMTSNTFPASAVTVPAVAESSTSDKSLIKRIAGGDKLAMQVLYKRHHVRIVRFVVRLVHEESMA
jgi:hypothetical protein